MDEIPNTEASEKEAPRNDMSENPDEHNSALGVWIPIGMLVGIAIGGFAESIGMAVGIAVGMLGGVVVGVLIDRRNGHRAAGE